MFLQAVALLKDSKQPQLYPRFFHAMVFITHITSQMAWCHYISSAQLTSLLSVHFYKHPHCVYAMLCLYSLNAVRLFLIEMFNK